MKDKGDALLFQLNPAIERYPFDCMKHEWKEIEHHYIEKLKADIGKMEASWANRDLSTSEVEIRRITREDTQKLFIIHFKIHIPGLPEKMGTLTVSTRKSNKKQGERDWDGVLEIEETKRTFKIEADEMIQDFEERWNEWDE